MEIYKLTNIDSKSPNWVKSPKYAGDIIVRAENCSNARGLASDRYNKWIITPYQDPWNDVNTVECVSIEDEQYDPEGPEEILFPEEYKYV